MIAKEYFQQNIRLKDKTNLVSGGVAGIWAMTATHPLERVKMMRIFKIKGFTNQNIFNSISIIARNKGLFSVFRGNAASCIREFPGAGLMFYFYERFKTTLTKNKDPNHPDLPYRVASGAMAGMISTTLTYSLDPVKAVMAGDYKEKAGNIRTIVKNIYLRNGFKGFYHGYTATIWSAIPFIGKYFYNLTMQNFILSTSLIILMKFL